MENDPLIKNILQNLDSIDNYLLNLLQKIETKESQKEEQIKAISFLKEENNRLNKEIQENNQLLQNVNQDIRHLIATLKNIRG